MIKYMLNTFDLLNSTNNLDPTVQEQILNYLSNGFNVLPT